MYTVN